MRKFYLAVSLILPATILTGCFHVPDDLNNSTSTEVQEMDFSTVAQGTGSYTDTTPKLLLIQSQPQLDQLWNMYVSGTVISPSPAPQIDFRANFVLAAFAGQKNTGGYSFSITGLNTNAQSGTSDIAVYATLNGPDPETFVTQALTSPYHVVQVKRRLGFQFQDVYMLLLDEETQTTSIVPVTPNDL